MKKLKLEALEISAGGRLTRQQLRNVVGGSEGGHCQVVADCGTGYNYACVNYVCVVVGWGEPCYPTCGAGKTCSNGVCI
ncbi:hypothetical protein [Mucilaginibacter flavidus]|uniref:hypothetical protein n=1 Tax=Mucilaginibacter flavidus TaxID=2949309 RepID=UPI002092DF19|nr:hypothetical protein [Mucilaginibacter flavidus]MCO5945640.1 hypothetical protein [Mucilaginibacter flavidus]